MKCRLKSKWHCWASDANMHSTGKGNVMKNGIEDELDDHDKNSIVQEVMNTILFCLRANTFFI